MRGSRGKGLAGHRDVRAPGQVGTEAAPSGWSLALEQGLFVLLQVAVSRALFLSAFVFGQMLKAGDFENQAHLLPGLADLGRMIVLSATAYSDLGWYQLLADEGYGSDFLIEGQRNWAFFPLFAWIMNPLGAPALRLLAPMAAFAASAWLLMSFVERRHGREAARMAVLALCYFPYSFTVSQFRPESFLLVLALLATWLAASGRPWLAAAPAALTGFAKPNAFLFGLIFASEAARDAPPGRRWPSRATLVLALAPLAGVAYVSARMWQLAGDPLAWARIQGAWGAKLLVMPAQQVVRLFTTPEVVGRQGWDPILLHWALLAMVGLVVVALARRRAYAMALFIVLFVGLTFSNFGVYVLGKHLSACFPLFIGLALALRGRPGLAAAAMALGAGLLGLNGLYAGAGLLFTMS